MNVSRRDKAKAKCAFIGVKNDLYEALEHGVATNTEVRRKLEELACAMETFLTISEHLSKFYSEWGEVDKGAALEVEMDSVETDFTSAEKAVSEYCHANKSKTDVCASNFAKSPPDLSLSPDQLECEVQKQEAEIIALCNEIQTARNAISQSKQRAEIEKSAQQPLMMGGSNTQKQRLTGTNKVNFQGCGSRNTELKQPVKDNRANFDVMQSASAHRTQQQPTCTPVSGLTDGPPSFWNVPSSTPFTRQLTPVSMPESCTRHGGFISSRTDCQPMPGHNYHDYEEVATSPVCVAYPQQSTIPPPLPVGTEFYSQHPSSESLQFDSARLLTRIPIPKFSGNKKNYEAWKAAFVACVDHTAATPEYKLLRLKNSLEGEALRVIESLGHSAAAYDVAKERLERKYGGTRRQIVLRLEELDKFKQIRENNAQDLERFAELLDVLTVNLSDVGQQSELGSGSLYVSLQRKLNESLLSRYHRWIHENNLPGSVTSLRSFINEESEFLMTATETVKGIMKDSKKENTRSLVTQVQETPKKSEMKCPLCDSLHGVWVCESFKGMEASQRWKKAKELQLCFRCLSSKHRAGKCSWNRQCGINGCKYRHHRLLHEPDRRTTQPKETSNPARGISAATNAPSATASTSMEGEKHDHSLTSVTMTSNGRDNFIALRTVPVMLRNGIHSVKINALLDDASSKSYINSDIAAQIGLEGSAQELTVHVLNDNTTVLNSTSVECILESVDRKVVRPITAHTTKRVTGNMQVVNWNSAKNKWEHLKGINFPSLGKRPIVDMLIGVDYADLHYSLREISGAPGEPMARLTPLGWTCVGNPFADAQHTHTNFTFFQHDKRDLNELVRRFWDIEEPPHKALVKPDEKYAYDTVAKSLSYNNGRYSVGMPWKPDRTPLPDNYEMAKRRLENTEKRLMRSPEVGKSYGDTLIRYLEKGYIRKVSPLETRPEQVWYLPHFPVLRPDKSTTKVRIVFDASARHENISLNDMVYQGPKLQNDLFAVLIRFRRDPVAIMCDIAEMYLQIELTQSDRAHHRFLWRGLDPNKKPDTYEFTRVVFGVNSSPFQAQFVSQHHAKLNKDKYPLAAETVLKSTYMDDSMDSVPDVPAAVQLYKELTQLWGSAGMHARKWLSNSPEVLKLIPASDCVTAVNLDTGELPIVKTLGVMWNPEIDKFRFCVNAPDANCQITKRSFLKKIATLFDPLGFLMPFTVRAKILFQEMWTCGRDWDEPVEESISSAANKWFDELEQLEELRVQRCIRLPKEFKEKSLHIFVDASQEAYGAAIYARYEYQDGEVTCNLLASKSRVAPLNAVSIPRLELMAAVIGLRLGKSVGQILDVQSQNWTFWSDSMDVLYWIRGRSRQFKPFVANRVGEIQESTVPNQWRYVPTDQNPADLLSRGLTVKNLSMENMWWHGPQFLSLSPMDWPENKVDTKELHEKELKKQFRGNPNPPTLQISMVVTVNSSLENRLDPTRFSSWVNLNRVHARVMRFVENCRIPEHLRRTGPVQPEEIADAENFYIKLAQQETFQKEFQAIRNNHSLPRGSRLLPLKPILDEVGVMRCDGRLQFADCLAWESRYPVILPRKHWITHLIIRNAHEHCQHMGTNQVLSHLSARYWIISAREAIREWERECMVCRRRKASPAGQIMAPLPKLRTHLSLRAFSQTSVDFAGPFITKQGRGKSRQKRYLCLFTCLATRAVHLEMAYALDTDSFLNAFYRMVSRRGLPQDVMSDNGTNFVGGHKELKELIMHLDKNKIQNTTANRGVKWHFNPPGAPHFNGVHEIMIKAAKRAIYSILGNADITDEELLSAIIGAEGLINSRPLTYQSANEKDIVPLTPNHFLHGQIGGEFAPESVDTTDYNLRKRWRRVQELVRHFWGRWLREWLPALNSRKKWYHTQDDLQVGDVVLVMATDTPRGKWPIGRVVQVFPGPDGRVRTADVRTSSNTIRRPSVKLCPLERSNNAKDA